MLPALNFYNFTEQKSEMKKRQTSCVAVPPEIAAWRSVTLLTTHAPDMTHTALGPV